jgi:hypothetical protein
MNASVKCCGRRFESALTACFLSLFFVGLASGAICLRFELLVICAVRTLYETAVLVVAFQHRNAEMLAVRRHLRDINERELNNEIDLTGSLQGDGAVDQSILIGNTG